MNLAPPGTTTMLTRCGDTRGECARSISLRLAQLKHQAGREATELDRVASLQVVVLIHTFDCLRCESYHHPPTYHAGYARHAPHRTA